jgi:small subunit ribosomal protein S16
LAVRIRLTRVGATKRPSYRVIAIDRRRARDGRALEILGFYDPLTDPATVQLDADRLNAWIDKGARPSDTVARLMRQAGIGGAVVEMKPAPAGRRAPPKPPKRTKEPKASRAAAPAAVPPAAAAPVEAEADAAVAEPAEAAPAEPQADASMTEPEDDASAPEPEAEAAVTEPEGETEAATDDAAAGPADETAGDGAPAEEQAEA